MPIYTFTPQIDREPYEAVDLNFAHDEAAKEAARDWLQGRVDSRPLSQGRAQAGTIGVGRGLLSNEDVDWLGEWEFGAPDAWLWTPSPGRRP